MIGKYSATIFRNALMVLSIVLVVACLTREGVLDWSEFSYSGTETRDCRVIMYAVYAGKIANKSITTQYLYVIHSDFVPVARMDYQDW